MHVLSIVVRVVEVDYAFVVRVDYILRQQYAVGKVAAHFAGDVVALSGVDDRVLVGILLLRFLVVALDEAEYLVVGGVRLTDELTGITIGNIRLRHLVSTVRHNLMLDNVLHLFDRRRAPQLFAVVYRALHDTPDLRPRHADVLGYRFVCLLDGYLDFVLVEQLFRAVSFNDFHYRYLPAFIFCTKNQSISYETIYSGEIAIIFRIPHNMLFIQA